MPHQEHVSASSSFNFYELIAYIIPGFFTIVLVFWLYINLVKSIEINLEKNIGFGESILFLAVSCLLGYFIQLLPIVPTLDNWFERRFQEFSKTDLFSDGYIEQSKGYAKRFFRPQDVSSNKGLLKRDWDLFRLCHSLLDQEKIIQKDTYIRTFLMYRGVKSTIYIGILVSSLIILKYVYFEARSDWSTALELPKSEIFSSISLNTFQLGLASVLFLLLFWFEAVWEARFKKLSYVFFDTVYKEFYVWVKRTNGTTITSTDPPSWRRASLTSD